MTLLLMHSNVYFGYFFDYTMTSYLELANEVQHWRGDLILTDFS